MEIRKEALEYGLLPSGVLSSRFDSVAAVTDLHAKLLKEAESINGQPGFVRIASVRRLLKLTPEVWKVMFYMLDSISCRSQRRGWRLRSLDGESIDLHALSLFLLTQIYGKHAAKRADYERRIADRMQLYTVCVEGAMKDNCRGHAPRGLVALTFSSFLRRHLHVLLYLIKDSPPDLSSPAWCLPRSPSPGVAPPPLDPTRGTIWISAEELDRLELLLHPKATENGRVGRSGLASSLSCFKSHRGADMAGAASIEIAMCLRQSILDTDGDSDTSSSGRVCGMTKGTLVQGEDSIFDDQLIIHECQDSCIYALAPLARAKVTSCSDCIIVLGPVSGCVSVENCTRIKLIFAATSTYITACHESIIHLATTRPPLLLGDNRFLQLAPYNIEYERLTEHLKMAKLEISPNLWDKPLILNLSREHRDEAASTSESRSSLEDLLLPPDQLLPFTIPFKGGPGPLAGGAPTQSQISWVNRLGSGMGQGPPFPLSSLYANALTARLRKVAELQESVGKV